MTYISSSLEERYVIHKPLQIKLKLWRIAGLMEVMRRDSAPLQKLSIMSNRSTVSHIYILYCMYIGQTTSALKTNHEIYTQVNKK